jgi:hypothetical protein
MIHLPRDEIDLVIVPLRQRAHWGNADGGKKRKRILKIFPNPGGRYRPTADLAPFGRARNYLRLLPSENLLQMSQVLENTDQH